VALFFETFYLLLTLVTQGVSMVVSFGSKETEKIWRGAFVKRWPNELQEIARRKLRMINNSQNVEDLRVPPSNKLEKLVGKLKQYYSIRMNDKWRIIFIWNNGSASEVEIIDYH
jgi:proteic killer suppression protein